MYVLTQSLMLATQLHSRSEGRPRLHRLPGAPCSLPISAAMARLTPFEVGQVKAHAYHGLGPAEIARIVKKSDGAAPSEQGIADVLQRLADEPKWRGERKRGSGRPRCTPRSLDKAIVKEVFRSRGSRKVTVAYLQQKIPAARRISRSCVAARLQEAGLMYLRRRKKSLVPEKYKQERLDFAESVKRMHHATLRRWAYTDGMVFYLDRSDVGVEHTQRAALGAFVWRKADCSDAMYSDCVGPSAYNKAQGLPVRVWGVLARGVLHITILPEGEVMNRWWYAWIIEHRFPGWLGDCDKIVQDFERCLRCPEPLAAFAKLSVGLVENYPRCSQDLNAIENAWALLRDRVYETMPTHVESRADFCVRLRYAVEWLNRNRHSRLLELCDNQKERASKVLEHEGGRTKW